MTRHFSLQLRGKPEQYNVVKIFYLLCDIPDHIEMDLDLNNLWNRKSYFVFLLIFLYGKRASYGIGMIDESKEFKN